MDRSRDSWNRSAGAEAYAEVVRTGVLYRALAAGLVELAAPRSGELLLDLACGTGIAIEAALARAGSSLHGCGVDRSIAMLAVARQEVPLDHVAFVCADSAALPLRAGSVDLAVCSAALWHFPSPGRAFAELARVLGCGGRFSFNVPAAQLEDEPDLSPTPIQNALLTEGRRRFGSPPAPAGPRRAMHRLLEDAASAGFTSDRHRVRDLAVPQRELVDLLAVPAIGARLYPSATAAARSAWIDAAARRIDLDEVVLVRWREQLLVKRDS